MSKSFLLVDKEQCCRNREGRLSECEIMTILVCCHFDTLFNVQTLQPLLYLLFRNGILPTVFRMPFRASFDNFACI